MTSSALNPEFNLLLAIARSESDLGTYLSGAQIDWDYLLNLALDQGMLPLLHTALSGLEAVPQEVMDALKAYYFENAQSNILLLGELVKLLKLLAEKGISVVPFKGVYLAKSLYNSYSLRQAGDIDLLVKPRDAILVGEILREQGYELYHPYSRNQQTALVNCSRENQLNLIDHRELMVEVHWRVFTRDLIGDRETAFIWENLEEDTLQDMEIMIFKPAMMLMYLCFHAFKHNWSRIFVLWELGQFITQNPSLDWGWILNHSENFGGENVLLLSLALTQSQIGTALPVMITKRIEGNHHLQEMLGKIKLAPDRYQLEVKRELDVRSLRDQFTIQSSLLARIGQFLRWATIPSHFDIIAADLPPALHFLYYLLRPFRLLSNGIRQLISRWKPSSSN